MCFSGNRKLILAGYQFIRLVWLNMAPCYQAPILMNYILRRRTKTEKQQKGVLTMSKSNDVKRDKKKAPLMTLAEKRQAKREKKNKIA